MILPHSQAFLRERGSSSSFLHSSIPLQYHCGCFPNIGKAEKPQCTANQQKVGLQWLLRFLIPLSPHSLSVTPQHSSKTSAWAFVVSIPGVCVSTLKAVSPDLTSLCLTAFQGLNPDKACLDLSLLAHNQRAKGARRGRRGWRGVSGGG